MKHEVIENPSTYNVLRMMFECRTFDEKNEIRERCKVPTQFHRTSNITETVISKDLRPMETRQTELQICSAYSFFIFARDFFWKPLSLKF